MAQITIIGAGSVMFTRQICSALLSYPAVAGSTITLMDIQSEVLKRSGQVVAKMIEQANLPVTVKMTTNQYDALQGADFVINAIQVGGLEHGG